MWGPRQGVSDNRRRRNSKCLGSFAALLMVISVLQSNSMKASAAHAPGAEEDLCAGKSCYPPTGNLLIGRKSKLSATSTCGLRKVERYCIVSPPENNTMCFMCDSRSPWSPHFKGKNSHRIENVVSENSEDKTSKWWQSENGVQNVSIRFDLEAEFNFTTLFMKFSSFKPAAMFIERSADFGKTWSIYRYSAFDCLISLPGDLEKFLENYKDMVNCTVKYSDMAPSTGGKLVYKLILPAKDLTNISRMLKTTNLRINFTKIHTVGDNLLDDRQEIDKKYYAISDLVVGGSCSCNGHAHSCIPMVGQQLSSASLRDMVHSKCECSHNTAGMNCNECKPLYNDIPWKAAIGTQPNECRRCECNSHASRCFLILLCMTLLSHPNSFSVNTMESNDQEVSIRQEASDGGEDKETREYRQRDPGFVSGGVCVGCMHNTKGKNCDQCKPYFYKDPRKPISDPFMCHSCECNKDGSLHDGICEGKEDRNSGLVAGKCYCKINVDGANCDRCKNGFWDLRKDNPDGCKPCDCDFAGSHDPHCDFVTGQCKCKPGISGRMCDILK